VKPIFCSKANESCPLFITNLQKKQTALGQLCGLLVKKLSFLRLSFHVNGEEGEYQGRSENHEKVFETAELAAWQKA